jgi:hypothetical protein
MGLGPILPETLASSKASRAAEFNRAQSLDRPSLRNDPAPRPPRCNQKNLQRGVLAEAIWQDPVLHAYRQLCLFPAGFTGTADLALFRFHARAPAQCGLEFDEAHWTERPAGSVRPASCAALKMETANRNASGAGVGNVHCGWNAAGPLLFRKMSGSQNTCSYRGDVLALVVELNLNPEVSKPTIKLILSRINVQPMAHAAHYLFRAMRTLGPIWVSSSSLNGLQRSTPL